MARQCARCGHLADDRDHFCASCGAELELLDDPAYQTGVLGLRVASEGDSSPLPRVDSASVSCLGAGSAVLVVLRGPQEGASFTLDPDTTPPKVLDAWALARGSAPTTVIAPAPPTARPDNAH